MRQIFLVGLLAGVAACGSSGQPPSEPKAELAEPQAEAPPLPLVAEVEPPIQPLEPMELDRGQRRALLRTFAGSEQAARVVRNKEDNGRVELSAGGGLDYAQAERDLGKAQASLAAMSSTGLPTFLLLHKVSDDGYLWSWLIGPEGVVAVDRSPERFDGLENVVDGLGVTRIAGTRSVRGEGEPPPTPEAIRAMIREDQSPRSRARREDTLVEARNALLPGSVGAALGKSAGRLLVIAAKDTGTAPYAALPLDNGFAAKHWSFVIMPDIKTLAGSDPTFDFRSLDLRKAVIVGDPDLSQDPLFDWAPLPGARREAQMVAERLHIPPEDVLMGDQATHKSFRRALNKLTGEGLVYIASHAVADPRNPLTRGFVAMTGEHYYAGYIRQEQFSDWRRQPPLVVMSACQTALGRVLEGGQFGVTRSWYKAGAGQVVGSLWNVSDPATLLLMHHFTSRLVAGDAPEIAMQYAQQKTMMYKDKKGNQPYLDDPKMWASFAIFGRPSRDPVS